MYFCRKNQLSFFLGRGRGPWLEQTWLSFTQVCCVPRFVEFIPAVLEKRIFKVRQCIFAISLLSPLRKGHGSSFEQTWIPFTWVCFVPSLVEIGLVVLKKMNMWKVYRRTDDQRDRRRTTGDQRSSIELYNKAL